MDYDILRRLLLPPLLGVAAAVVVTALRFFGPIKRLRVWAMLTGITAGAWLSVTGSGIPWEETVRQGFAALALLAGTATVLRLFDLVFWDWFLANRRHIVVPRLLVDLVKLLALVAVLIGILKFVYARELSGLLVTSTVVSAIIGLALQDMLANIAAGLGLQMEKPFTVGDWLLVNQKEGFVTQLNWRSLTIQTRDGNEVIVPNAVVAKSEIVNYSRPSSVQRLHVTVGVAYQHPPGIVKKALERATVSAPEVARQPPVEILVRAYRDFYIEYDVRFWITDFDRVYQISDDVLSRIWYELRRTGLTIPMPTREISMRTVSDEQETRAAESRRRRIFGVLRPLAVFAPLSDEQIGILVGAASMRSYMAGETLVQQGEAGASLFVIGSGKVRIDKSRGTRGSMTVATMGAGDFFGEMSLLTGEPRTASVVAETETEAVVVDKAAFAAVLSLDTGVLPGLSAVLEARNNEAAGVEDPSAIDETPKPPAHRSALLNRIGRFFGIDEDRPPAQRRNP